RSKDKRVMRYRHGTFVVPINPGLATSSAGFKPRERAILFLEIKMSDFELGDAWRDLQKPAVGHHGNAIDLSVMIGNELEMREERVKASPARKRACANHDASEFSPRRNHWIYLARGSLEVDLRRRPDRAQAACSIPLARFLDLPHRHALVGRFHAAVRGGARWREGAGQCRRGANDPRLVRRAVRFLAGVPGAQGQHTRPSCGPWLRSR